MVTVDEPPAMTPSSQGGATACDEQEPKLPAGALAGAGASRHVEHLLRVQLLNRSVDSPMPGALRFAC